MVGRLRVGESVDQKNRDGGGRIRHHPTGGVEKGCWEGIGGGLQLGTQLAEEKEYLEPFFFHLTMAAVGNTMIWWRAKRSKRGRRKFLTTNVLNLFNSIDFPLKKLTIALSFTLSKLVNLNQHVLV